MMKNIIIVRVAEGLGNQLFMYANSYNLAKEKNSNLWVDDESGFFKKKNQLRNRKFQLNAFNLDLIRAKRIFKFNNYLKDLVRKILKIINLIIIKKIFIIEHKSKKKITFYKNIEKINLAKKCYIEGHFESEKYFIKYENELKKIITIKDALLIKNNPFLDKIQNSNSISIHVRRHKFTEEAKKKQNKKLIELNQIFDQKLYEYIKRGIKFFEQKVDSPNFFLWSNDFDNLDRIFDQNKIIFIKGLDLYNEFHLFSKSKHFIVGASTFHWWAAWLNNNPNKICIRPKDDELNPSKNIDFWPESWLAI